MNDGDAGVFLVAALLGMVVGGFVFGFVLVYVIR